jgi:hypothetical protein
MIDIIWNELQAGFPDTAQLVRVIIRLQQKHSKGSEAP